jgi:thioredoxin 1
MASFLKRLRGDKEAEAETAATTGNGQATVEPIHVGDADFEEIILQAGVPAIVDLWAEWCGPCHMIAPSVNSLAAEYEGRAIVAKLNVDENPNTPMRFGIMGIPTLLYFKDGKEVDRQVGVAGYAQLAAKLERLLD